MAMKRIAINIREWFFKRWQYKIDPGFVEMSEQIHNVRLGSEDEEEKKPNKEEEEQKGGRNSKSV